MSKIISSKKKIRKNLVNIPGWRTNRKIVVIESDDWGSIRMPSKKVYDFLLKNGVPVDQNYFTKYDSLECDEDLEKLFEVLTSFKDKNGNHPAITANTLLANPDFEKIENAAKKEYHYELITKTYKTYPRHSAVMHLWKEYGIKKNLLYPQYHGREHLNVKKWLRVLSGNHPDENAAFDSKVLLGLSVNSKNRLNSYMAAFEYETEDDKKYIEEITADGLSLFDKIFGFKSVSFVPSQSIMGDHINYILSENGVKFHQAGQYFIPQPGGKLKKINRFWGSKNKYGQIYWRRNCTFEPSRDQDFDWVNSCLAEMDIAFRWKKPAVINAHRVNFTGSIFAENREQSLIKLKLLFQRILRKWPDVEFYTSEDLGKLIDGSI